MILEREAKAEKAGEIFDLFDQKEIFDPFDQKPFDVGDPDLLVKIRYPLLISRHALFSLQSSYYLAKVR